MDTIVAFFKNYDNFFDFQKRQTSPPPLPLVVRLPCLDKVKASINYDIQRLHANIKWIMCFSQSKALLFYQNAIAVPHFFIKTFNL